MFIIQVYNYACKRKQIWYNTKSINLQNWHQHNKYIIEWNFFFWTHETPVRYRVCACTHRSKDYFVSHVCVDIDKHIVTWGCQRCNWKKWRFELSRPNCAPPWEKPTSFVLNLKISHSRWEKVKNQKV